MRWLAVSALILLAGCAATSKPTFQPPPGPNPVFDQALESTTSNRLIVTDLKLGPDAVGVAHYHPWEEFLYVIEGSAMVELAGESPRRLVAGEQFVIPARLVHTPRAGPDGARAIVVRVHRDGDPVSVPVTP